MLRSARVRVGTHNRRRAGIHGQRATNHGAAARTGQRSGIGADICSRQRLRQGQRFTQKHHGRGAIGIEFIRGACTRIERVDDRSTTTHRHARVVAHESTCPLLAQRQRLGDPGIGVGTRRRGRTAGDGQRAVGSTTGQRTAASAGHGGGVHRRRGTAAKGFGRQGDDIAGNDRNRGTGRSGRRGGAECRVVEATGRGHGRGVTGGAVGTPDLDQVELLRNDGVRIRSGVVAWRWISNARWRGSRRSVGDAAAGRGNRRRDCDFIELARRKRRQHECPAFQRGNGWRRHALARGA